ARHVLAKSAPPQKGWAEKTDALAHEAAIPRDTTVHPSKPLHPQNASGFPSLKNPPVGPSSGRVASHTIPAAPSSTGFWAPIGPPMSVLTKPGHAEFTLNRSPCSSGERVRVTALRDALETRYPGDHPPISETPPMPLDTFTIRGLALARRRGSNAIVNR